MPLQVKQFQGQFEGKNEQVVEGKAELVVIYDTLYLTLLQEELHCV